MDVFLILKSGFQDSFNLISQIAKIDEVEQITVFRDTTSLPNEKVKYVLTKSSRFNILKHLSCLIQIIKRRSLKPSILISIYKIPQSLIIAVVGKFLKILGAVPFIEYAVY